MVHISDGKAWKHFDVIHHEKTEEAHNVHVVLATDGFNPYGVVVTDRPPAMMTGDKVRQQIDGLVANPEGGFVGYGEQHIYVDK